MDTLAYTIGTNNVYLMDTYVYLEHLDDLWLAGKANANRSAGASTTTSLGRILNASSAHLGRIFSEPCGLQR